MDKFNILIYSRVMEFELHIQQYFSYIVAVSLIGGVPGGNNRPAASH